MSPKPKRTGLYLRVSTLDQSTDLQRRELTEYAAARGWNIVRIYEDHASGTTGNRPMLKELMKDVRARKLDLVVCWKLDRFFRSLKDLVVTLQELADVGVEFASLKDSIDMGSSSGKLLMHLLGAFAEFEASLIQERVRAGLAAAKANGKRLGRPKTRNDEKILALHFQGKSIRAIARELQVSTGAVQRALAVSKSPLKVGGKPE